MPTRIWCDKNYDAWKCHVNDSTKRGYDIILGRYLLTAIGLDLNFSYCLIIGNEVPYEGCSAPMVYVINYNYTRLTDKIIEP